MEHKQVVALFDLANIKVLNIWEIPNEYWPKTERYAELRETNPWWLVKTPAGIIKIGNRKRVISIDWSDTKIRGEITKDDVTKSDDMVHAWSMPKALEYMTALGVLIKKYEKEPMAWYSCLPGQDPVLTLDEPDSTRYPSEYKVPLYSLTC